MRPEDVASVAGDEFLELFVFEFGQVVSSHLTERANVHTVQLKFTDRPLNPVEHVCLVPKHRV